MTVWEAEVWHAHQAGVVSMADVLHKLGPVRISI